jgi:hypothetical protein
MRPLRSEERQRLGAFETPREDGFSKFNRRSLQYLETVIKTAVRLVPQPIAKSITYGMDEEVHIGNF